MKLDKEELELLDLVDKTDKFERLDDYGQALLEAKIMAKNYQHKEKK
ncbi:MAG: hypothetical protein HFP77_06300 [Methylococcales symbiont of Iophon sp. n. MRB-2018]|nr:MAG: hypothetical protein HFP77_06300 [Methylococcales symbiont of Iophon sp. n. MRB-2018]KAF3978979.1 MAG: hypothetical protein HFP76_09625 [Methylococcales symbiont of Iophon sp. n. MRB-2018]